MGTKCGMDNCVWSIVSMRKTVKWPLQRNSRLKLHLDSAYCMQVLPTVKKVVGTKY